MSYPSQLPHNCCLCRILKMFDMGRSKTNIARTFLVKVWFVFINNQENHRCCKCRNGIVKIGQSRAGMISSLLSLLIIAQSPSKRNKIFILLRSLSARVFHRKERLSAFPVFGHTGTVRDYSLGFYANLFRYNSKSSLWCCHIFFELHDIRAAQNNYGLYTFPTSQRLCQIVNQQTTKQMNAPTVTVRW